MNLITERDTKALACKFASVLQKGDVVVLNGGLGAGKTTFVQHVLRSNSFAVEDDITSPTFTLVNVYYAKDGTMIQHMDCYRLEEESELEQINVEEHWDDTLTFIEWSDKFAFFSLPDCIRVDFTFESGDNRIITIEGIGSCKERVGALI